MPCKYYEIKDFVGNLAEVSIRTDTPITVKWTAENNRNRQYTSRDVVDRAGIVNKNGKEIIPCNNLFAVIRSDIIFVRTMTGEEMYFDKSGNRIRR